MSKTLLSTKLFIPPTRPNLVRRSRLIDQLNAGLYRKLTLISAPAGFGKTTLVSEWISACECPAAWLSLDENDSNPTKFLTYLITALHRKDIIEPPVFDDLISKLQLPQPLPAQTILTSLINEIADCEKKCLLVLDDYQLVISDSVDEALNFLLENLPLQLHLVIATREDPQLPLGRFRAKDQMTELRAADLRFTSQEAAEFLNRVMGLNLSPEDITALEKRTEGWIAGLQLAAISLQGRADTHKLINSFTGSNRLILDYLIEDVLKQQPETIQAFLLQTAILDRLNGSLCDAVMGQENSQKILEQLERANLFIVPLDNERRWYRYHRLFADLLRQRLRQKISKQLPILHLRASHWFEQNGFIENAIEHSLKIDAFERVADLAEFAWREMNLNYQSITWLKWVKSLPEELILVRPMLSTDYGWALIDIGDFEAANLRLRDAERWFERTISGNQEQETSTYKPAVLNEEQLRSLSIWIANGRAYLTQALGDVPATIQYAQQALDLLPKNNYFERGLSAILLGFAYWSSGNLEEAYQAVNEAISNMQILGNISYIISFSSYLTDIMISQGRLREAERTYSKLLEFANKQGTSTVKESAVLHLGLSEIYLEQGDMEAAKFHLDKSEELGNLPSFPPWFRHWTIARIKIKESEGDLDGVLKILGEAENMYYRHPIPDVTPLPALISRAQLAQGRLNDVLLWVNESGLSINDDLSYLREFEHITLARLMIAQYRQDRDDRVIQDLIGFMERLLKAAEEGGRLGSIIEILALQALAYQAVENIPRAHSILGRALTLAEPEGYLRVFVREGPPMEALLKKVKVEDGKVKEYMHKLLTAFNGAESHLPISQPLLDPLSERELEVLALIAQGLTNQEIGRRLYLSLNTVKVHTRNIYSKLGVNNRTQAVAQSRELGILTSD